MSTPTLGLRLSNFEHGYNGAFQGVQRMEFPILVIAAGFRGSERGISLRRILRSTMTGGTKEKLKPLSLESFKVPQSVFVRILRVLLQESVWAFADV